jgi:glycyl-tRNA synthetase beta chain
MYDFILDRLKGYYADKGVPATHFNAVAELKPHSLYDFDRRIDAIGTFAQLPEAEALAAANKRIRNILRKAEGEVPADGRHVAVRAGRAGAGRSGGGGHRRHRCHWRSATTSACSAGWPSCAAGGCVLRPGAGQCRGPGRSRQSPGLLKTLGERFGRVAAIEHLSA